MSMPSTYFVKCLSLSELRTQFKTSCFRTTQKFPELKMETFPEKTIKKKLSPKISKETLDRLKNQLCTGGPGVLCFLRLWKSNQVSRKPCKRRSDLVLNGVPK